MEGETELRVVLEVGFVIFSAAKQGKKGKNAGLWEGRIRRSTKPTKRNDRKTE